ncbi:MAG: PQQ-dependent sugar dehydrogenase [Gammaproteobacteria bacterium]|nr:PQQ-dependent sugar dehydrogenase [Gammaproteobacteria bacterium]
MIQITRKQKITAILLCLMLAVVSLSHARDFNIRVLAQGLNHPWSMAFLPDGSMLVTERSGKLRLLNKAFSADTLIKGLPSIRAMGQGGLLDVAIHPDYRNNGWIYFSYSGPDKADFSTEVGRARLQGDTLIDWQTLFKLMPKSNSSYHFGSRLVFGRQGDLYITLGDRGDRYRAQKLHDHAGSVIRLHDDGRVPEDNPFTAQKEARAEIYSYGHRNLQGAALHPVSGRLWTHEHGPQGGDELNMIQAGANYGWPVISYGEEYGTDTPVGEGTHKPGMQQPLHYWVPSIAPSGMAFYTGDRFPQWKGSLFIGSLKFRLLVRLELDGDKVIKEERLLKDKLGRIRDVRNGPDGYLYLLTDAANGKLVRLEPAAD